MNSFALAPGCASKLSSNVEICCKAFASFTWGKFLKKGFNSSNGIKKGFLLICSPPPHCSPSEYIKDTSLGNAPQSLPKKQIKNKTHRVLIKYPNKNWTPRNAKWTSDSTSKPKPNWAAKSHPVLRGSRAFREMCGRCVLPKNHYTHLAHVSPGRGSCTEWELSSGTMWWHQLLKQKTRSLLRPSGKAAGGAGGRPGNIKGFSCTKARISVPWRSQLTEWQAQASFGTCVTENNVVTCPQLSRQAAVRVYLHQGPLEQQLWVLIPGKAHLLAEKLPKTSCY